MLETEESKDAVAAIVAYGERYRQEMLFRRYVPDELLANWQPAFDFFLGRACYQGRSDRVSDRVYEATRDVLEASFYPNPSWSDPAFPEFRARLEARVGKGAGKPGKARDVEMVVSALHTAAELPDHNLVRHSKARLEAGELAAHYDELQAASSPRGITQVGPKIAAFYLRDLVSLYGLDGCVAEKDLALLQPVDVWVRRLAARLGLAAEDAPDELVRAAIVDRCAAEGCSTLLFNQGLWYLGAHAFDLLLERLGLPAGRARRSSHDSSELVTGQSDPNEPPLSWGTRNEDLEKAVAVLNEPTEVPLRRFIADKVEENEQLDYKREMSLGRKEDKTEAAKDVSVLANTSGGLPPPVSPRAPPGASPGEYRNSRSVDLLDRRECPPFQPTPTATSEPTAARAASTRGPSPTTKKLGSCTGRWACPWGRRRSSTDVAARTPTNSGWRTGRCRSPGAAAERCGA